MFCPKCGSQLPDDSVFCRHCGEKLEFPVFSGVMAQSQMGFENSINAPIQTNYELYPVNTPYPAYAGLTESAPSTLEKAKKNTAKIAIICSLSTLAAVLLIYIGYNYINATDNIKAEQFVAAQNNLHNILIAEHIMSEQCELVEAGVLFENEKYLDALHAFQKLSNVPQELMSKVEMSVYSKGRSFYRNDNFSEATTYFNEVYNFERSKDYLTLINIKNDISHVGYYYDVLYNLSGFEDAGEILFSTEDNAIRFLTGEWENVDGYYFGISDNYACTASYNLPNSEVYGGYAITNGVFVVGYDNIEFFKFTIIDKDVISVYCCVDSSTHILHRQ